MRGKVKIMTFLSKIITEMSNNDKVKIMIKKSQNYEKKIKTDILIHNDNMTIIMKS